MRIRMLRSLPAALLALASAAATQLSPPLLAGDLVLRGGLLFDSVGDTAVPNTGVVVRNGTLTDRVLRTVRGKPVETLGPHEIY